MTPHGLQQAWWDYDIDTIDTLLTYDFLAAPTYHFSHSIPEHLIDAAAFPPTVCSVPANIRTI